MSESLEMSGLHRWRFFRSGGFDQVRIETAQDLRSLDQLDPKLWAVLACPTSGLEFDRRTLQRIDTDGDGSIRVPELLHAVRWVCEQLHHPQLLFQPGADLPLDALRTDTAAGAALYAAAHQVLQRLGKPTATQIGLDDLSDPARLFPPALPNGDGVVPVELAPDAACAELIVHLIATQGAQTDRSGQPGVTQAGLTAFLEQAQQALDWHQRAPHRPGAGLEAAATGQLAALQAYDAVQAKVDDFFTRCRLLDFDPRAEAALNPDEARYTELASLTLHADSAELAALPLARVQAGAALPLSAGVNPAWQSRLAALREAAVRPLLGDCEVLTPTQWDDLGARLADCRAWLAARPADALADWSPAALRQWLDGPAPARLAALIELDRSAAASAAGIEGLELLLRLRRDLVPLLRNFVNLSDFYGQQHPAIFQAGTLYIDQRSCTLCLRVADLERHSALAPLSGAYLIYCECTRPDEEPITIVAALTGGDADELLVAGRNALFYDRQGRDWKAQVLRVVEAPISVSQAFWMPYRRLARFISAQAQRLAAAREQNVEAQSAAGAAAAVPGAAAPVSSQAFDIARFAGIFAAIGLALGALGTALAAIMSGLLRLPPWQMPLVLLGLLLLISGPSMWLAWFKLRQRNLGPLLDANGWAVNIRARLNIPFGAALTGVAQLPAGAERSLIDPYAEPARPWGWYAVAALLALVLALTWLLRR
ncbi:MAG: hypothetical protein AB1735_11400 [Pseudomonadota bacterium]